MTPLFHYALLFHIVNGTVALIVAPLAMMTVKGGVWHRRWGKIYFWAMACVAASATVMCFIRTGLFLFLIAIFSFYLALTGYTALRRKKPEDRPGWLDWFATIAMLVAGTALVVTGILDSSIGRERYLRVVFGGIGLALSLQDIRRFFKPSLGKRAWMYNHMTRFLAAYIATVTAFSVVNFQFLPTPVRWFWPTAIGTAGIIIWRRYYERKFNRQPELVSK